MVRRWCLMRLLNAHRRLSLLYSVDRVNFTGIWKWIERVRARPVMMDAAVDFLQLFIGLQTAGFFLIIDGGLCISVRRVYDADKQQRNDFSMTEGLENLDWKANFSKITKVIGFERSLCRSFFIHYKKSRHLQCARLTQTQLRHCGYWFECILQRIFFFIKKNITLLFYECHTSI